MTSEKQCKNPSITPKTQKYFTFQELEELKGEREWMVYEDSAYDLKPFLPYHPGGELLMRHLLYTDVTDHLGKFHPDYVTREKLPRFLMGKVDDKTFPPKFFRSRTPAAQDFHRMEAEMRAEGLFDPCYFYYIREFVKVLALFYIALRILVSGTDSWLLVLFAATLHGFANQQMAFFIHDSSHNAITQIRKYDFFISTILANLFGGFSVGLWKAEHQAHHVVTNDVAHDPDIQFIPFLAISTKFFPGVYSSFHKKTISFGSLARALVRVQHIIGYLYVPLVKFVMYIVAPLFVIFSPQSMNGTAKELLLMALYYVWFGYFLSFLPCWHLGAMYFIVSNVITSIVFLQIVLAHFAMPSIDFSNEREFFRHQFLVTVDVSCHPWLDWIHGGLNYQVPHHVWPRIARPNLRRVEEYLVAFCKRNDIEFKIVSLTECLRMVIANITAVAHHVDVFEAEEAQKKLS